MLLRGLAEFAMKGYWQSAIMIAVMSFLSLLLPPASYLASALIALATLRAGPQQGLKVLLLAALAFCLPALVVSEQPQLMILLVLASWVPVYGMTLVLGYSRSLAYSLLVSTAIGLGLVLLSHLFVDDLTAWWLSMMSPLVELLASQPGWQADSEQTLDMMTALAKIMTGLMVAGIFLSAVLGMLLGRSWQSGLYDPGSFGHEFRHLSLGKVPAIIASVVITLSVLPTLNSSLIQDCLPILVALFALQGIAKIHALVKRQNQSRAWLIVMYVLLLLIMPQMAFLLALIGISSQWFKSGQRSLGQDD